MHPYNQITGGNTPHPYSSGSGAQTRTTVGNANYTIKSWDEVVALTAALTAVRDWTLPPANSVQPGTIIWATDEIGGVDSTKYVHLLPSGGDLINGIGESGLLFPYFIVPIVSNGRDAWSISDVLLGSVTGSLFVSENLDIAGDVNVTGALEAVGDLITHGGLRSISSTEPIGYNAGAGGTVTQLTSKATAVTLNRPVGRITTHNAALAAGASVSFTVNNSAYNLTDLVILNSLNANYRVEFQDSAGDGSFIIRVTNLTAGSLSQAVILSFAIINGVLS